jgi:hypothetical protein
VKMSFSSSKFEFESNCKIWNLFRKENHFFSLIGPPPPFRPKRRSRPGLLRARARLHLGPAQPRASFSRSLARSAGNRGRARPPRVGRMPSTPRTWQLWPPRSRIVSAYFSSAPCFSPRSCAHSPPQQQAEPELRHNTPPLGPPTFSSATTTPFIDCVCLQLRLDLLHPVRMFSPSFAPR